MCYAIKSHIYCISINALIQNLDRIIPNYVKYGDNQLSPLEFYMQKKSNWTSKMILHSWFMPCALFYINNENIFSCELNNELRLRKWVILTECLISTPIVIKTKWPKLYCNQIDSFADDFKTVHRLLRIKICFTFVDGIP